MNFLKNTAYNKSLISYLIFAMIAIAWIVLIVNRIDNSWDGLWYHKAAIVKIVNPDIYYEWKKPSGTGDFADTEFIIKNYPALPHIISTLFVYVTGSLNSASFLNLVCLIILLHSFVVLAKHLEINITNTILLSVCLIINPVAVGQWHTSMIDGAQYYIASASLFHALSCRMTKGKENYWQAILLAITSMAFKLNGAILFFIVLALTLPMRRLNLRSSLLILVAMVLILWSPYVNNFLSHGNPLYPFVGDASKEIVRAQVSKEFFENNSIQQFISSIFSMPVNSKTELPNLSLKLDPKIWSTLSAADVRYGGFGPYYGYFLSISLIMMVANLYFAKGKVIYFSKMTLLVSIVILLFSMLHPAGWWARFSPTLWLIPVLAFVSTLHSFTNLQKTTTILIYIFFIWNIFVFFNVQIKQQDLSNKVSFEINKIQKGHVYALDMSDPSQTYSRYHHGPSLSRIFTEKGASLTSDVYQCEAKGSSINLPHGNRACRVE